MVQEKSGPLSLCIARFANPLLIVVITIASFFLLDAYFTETDPFVYYSAEQQALDLKIALIYLILGIIIYFMVSLIYEKPIHRTLGMLRKEQIPTDAEINLARLRAMNVPLIYSIVTAAIWLFAMMLFPFLLSMLSPPILRSYWMTGTLITFFIGSFILLLIYFSVSALSRIRFLPHLFPLGHLETQIGGHSLSLRAKFLLVFFALCALPLLLNLSNTLIWRYVILPEAGEDVFTVQRLAQLNVSQSAYLSLFSFVMGLTIVFCFFLHTRRGLRAISDVVDAVHRGDLSQHVAVTSRDEIGRLGDCVNEMIIGLRERKRIVEAFNRYVDKTLTKQVLNGDLVMGGIQLEVSIIYCDIRDYTTLSEGMEPDGIVAMLNRYFTRMAEAIEESGGSVNKFIGDAILAVFGTPDPLPDHRDRAIRAALAMYHALGEFNAEQNEDRLPELRIGIGVHSGLVLAGNIGTESKIEYTVIGDPVNVAQRIEELTIEKGAPIICSSSTLGPYKQRYPHESLGMVQLKGRIDPVAIYSLMPAYAELYRKRTAGT
jgi:class 3 adenylate cyclase